MKNQISVTTNRKGLNFKVSNRYLLWLLALLYLAVSLSGCASMKGVSTKFTPQVHANIGIFADTTIALIKDADLGLTQDQTVFVRDYFDVTGKEEKELFTTKLEVAKSLRGIVRYSVDLVTITETHDTEAKMIAAYADYIAGLSAETLKKLNFKKDHYDELVQNIRSQETFLDAMKMAQPIINAASKYMNLKLDEMRLALDSLALKFDRKIDERYKEIVEYQQALEKEKYAVLRALGRVYRMYKGDTAAMDELIASRAILSTELIPTGKPSLDELKAIADHLTQRLKALHLIGMEIKPDWDNYRNTHRELDTLYFKAKDRINDARLVALAWLRAHQKMAAGVASPAEWYNINDLPAQLFKLGTSAIF